MMTAMRGLNGHNIISGIGAIATVQNNHDIQPTVGLLASKTQASADRSRREQAPTLQT